MFILGLTGSIGMGKSVTARLFAESGILVHDADAAVHRLYEGEAVAVIVAAFAVHPLVRKSEAEFLAAAHAGGARTVLLDIPLLFETGGETRVDAVVVVSAPPQVQRARALARPGMTPAKLAAILAKQMPDSEKRARAHFMVDSSRGIDSARAQVRGILRAVSFLPGRPTGDEGRGKASSG